MRQVAKGIVHCGTAEGRMRLSGRMREPRGIAHCSTRAAEMRVGFRLREFVVAEAGRVPPGTRRWSTDSAAHARPRARSSSRPSTRSLSARSPLCSYSLVSQVRAPRIWTAVSSENPRSTYGSSA